MNYETQMMLLALANLAVCTAIGWACVKRMTVMRKQTTAFSWRLRYALLFTVASLSGWSPILFGDWPGISQVLVNFAFLSVIGTGKAWADGVPSYAKKHTDFSRSHA